MNYCIILRNYYRIFALQHHKITTQYFFTTIYQSIIGNFLQIIPYPNTTASDIVTIYIFTDLPNQHTENSELLEITNNAATVYLFEALFGIEDNECKFSQPGRLTLSLARCNLGQVFTLATLLDKSGARERRD